MPPKKFSKEYQPAAAVRRGPRGLSIRTELRKKLRSIKTNDPEGRIWAQVLVEETVKLAIKGNPQALKLVWNYMESPPQPEREESDNHDNLHQLVQAQDQAANDPL